jgi:spore cortex formation protein SpoVR/YcgB (stage V sporulation)
MTLETFGLRLALRDQEFKSQLKKIEDDEDTLAEVENKLSYDLIDRRNSPEIDIKNVSRNGENRQTIDYTEDGKMKKLYFSKEKDGWKINYYAGRKVV